MISKEKTSKHTQKTRTPWVRTNYTVGHVFCPFFNFFEKLSNNQVQFVHTRRIYKTGSQLFLNDINNKGIIECLIGIHQKR